MVNSGVCVAEGKMSIRARLARTAGVEGDEACTFVAKDGRELNYRQESLLQNNFSMT